MKLELAEPHLAARAREALQEQLDRVGASAEEVAGFEAQVGQAGPVLCAAADRLSADVIVSLPSRLRPCRVIASARPCGTCSGRAVAPS